MAANSTVFIFPFLQYFCSLKEKALYFSSFFYSTNYSFWRKYCIFLFFSTVQILVIRKNTVFTRFPTVQITVIEKNTVFTPPFLQYKLLYFQ